MVWWRDAGYRLGNADCTVCLQAPKIGSYIQQMRQVLAGILEADVEQISIKATTGERIGFVGRQEGCGCVRYRIVVSGQIVFARLKIMLTFAALSSAAR